LTADAAGEEAYNRYLCVATTVWSRKEDDFDGERIFPDIASFEKASAHLRNQVLMQYMAITRSINDYVAPWNTELSFFRDYGFLDKDGNIYDFAKKEIAIKLSEDEQEEQGRILEDFTDDDGTVVEKSTHPSFLTGNETKQAG